MRRRQGIETLITVGALGALWIVTATLGNRFGMSIAVLIVLYYLLATSLNVIMGFTDLISFGQSAFFGLGAYAAALTATHLGAGLLGGMAVGIVLSGVLALIVSSVSRALSGVYFALATMAAAEIVHIVLLNWVDFTRGPLGFSLKAADRVLVPGVLLTPQLMFTLVLGTGVIVTLVIGLFVRSDRGVRSIGVRENADLSASVGIVPARQRALAFLISGSIASVAGALYAFNYGILTPELSSLWYSALALLMVTFGGKGTILGPLVGAAVFVALPELIGLQGTLGQVVFALVLLLVVLLLPRGVVGSIGARGSSVGGIIEWVQRRRRRAGDASDGRSA